MEAITDKMNTLSILTPNRVTAEAEVFLSSLKKIVHEHDIRTLELEFRVGFHNSSGFISSLPKIVWTTAKNKLTNGVETLTVDKYVRSRPGESCRHVTTTTGKYIEYKKKVANDVDVNSGPYAIRSAIALETREPADPPNSFVMQRTKNRTSFRKGPWQIDFTRVEMIPIKNDIEEVYEIEVELVDTGYLFERELNLIVKEGIEIARKLM